VPDPGALRRPKLWAPPRPGEPPRGFTGLVGGSSPSRRQRQRAWLAVGVMLAGVVLVAFGVALWTWTYVAVGAAAGAAGALLSWRARIMEDVSTSDDPGHHG
jgi:CHASE2 domain-containing sensor protein